MLYQIHCEVNLYFYNKIVVTFGVCQDLYGI